MSLNIPHGYKLPPMTNRELFAWMRKLKAKFEADAPRRLAARVATRACKLADRQATATLFGLDWKTKRESEYQESTALALGSNEIFKGLKESPTFCERDHYQIDLTVLEHNGQLLCLLHNQSRHVTMWFEAHSGATHWPYQNCTDRPEGIPAREWNRRGKIWNVVLGSGLPEENGFGIKSRNPQNFAWRVREFPPTVPAKKIRAMEMAEEYLWHIFFKHVSREETTCSAILAAGKKISTHKGRQALTNLIEPHLKTIRRWSDLEVPVRSIIIPKP